MFGKLKEKLKGWFSSSKEKVEEVSEVVETEEEVIEKADKIIEKAKKEKSQEIPTEFETGTLKVEPDIEKIKEDIKEKIKEIPQEEPESVKYAQEEIRETQKKAEEIQKEIERIEKNLEEKKQGILSRIKSTFAFEYSYSASLPLFATIVLAPSLSSIAWATNKLVGLSSTTIMVGIFSGRKIGTISLCSSAPCSCRSSSLPNLSSENL